MVSNMVQTISLLPAMLLNLLRGEKAQDTFEYLLIIGGVSVAVIAAIALAAPNLLTPVVSGVCSAVDTVVPGTPFTCP